jgi:hypothetical protein
MTGISFRHGVAHAYGMVFARPLTVIGLTWLPALFYAEGAAFLLRKLEAAMAVAVPSAGGLFSLFAMLYALALVALTALLTGVIAVPLTREALGLREERAAVYFVIGAREFRMFFGIVRYYGLVLVSLAVLVLSAGIAITQAVPYFLSHGMAAPAGISIELLLNAAAGLVCGLWLLILTSRFGFLLNPVGANEDATRLSRSVALSRGHGWTIAAMILAISVPAGVVLVASELTFGGLSGLGHGFVIAPGSELVCAAIFATGLVVLNTLFAGASASVYAEMAEATIHDQAQAASAVFHSSEQSPPEYAPSEYPSAIAAAHHAAAPHMAEPQPELVSPAGMQVATFEAPHQADSGPSMNWVAPPPDAHFGTAANDALPAEAMAGTSLWSFAAPQAAEAQPVVQPESAAPQDAPEGPPAIEAAALPEAIGAIEQHVAGLSAASPDTVGPDSPTDIAAAEPSEATTAPGEPTDTFAAHVDGPVDPWAPVRTDDTAPKDLRTAMNQTPSVPDQTLVAPVGGVPFTAEVMPDHALNAEFPPPPLDPVGIMAAHGFHSPQ